MAGLLASQQVTGVQAKVQAQALIQAALGKGNGAAAAAAAASATAAVGGSPGIGAEGLAKGAGSGASGPMNGEAQNRIYVGGVSADLTCETIKAVFEPFGKINEVRLVPEPGAPGKHRGYGFIQYDKHKPAQVGEDSGQQRLRLG